MSNYQNYGTQHMQQYTPQYPPQYPPANNQNYGHDSYQVNQSGVSDEYIRQPAVAPPPPYPTAPYHMPEPVQALPTITPVAHTYTTHHHHTTTEPPRVVIVQQPVQQEDDCCACLRMICGCIDCILTKICYCITFAIIIIIIIGLVVYFTKFYKQHMH